MTAFAPQKKNFDCRSLAGLLFILSLAALAAAWAFELIGGYKPCPLCLMQRYAYYFALPAALGAVALLSKSKNHLALVLLGLSALAYLINAGLGVYHSGVEWHLWAGPTDCSGTGGALATEAGSLLQSLSDIRVVRCDEAPWRLFGLSFAGYNVLISLGLAGLAILAAGTLRRSTYH
ncbi:disulfide bond formation protein B [bacterium MnTg02]|nr:disulfide bond formation protein B [bacterium MnTg02]